MRELQPHWNEGLVVASIAISLLGTFTSTQLVCQARLSRHISAVLLWTFLASLTFGFCSIWCLHFVAMLAYELDLPIGLNIPLTVLSAFLAVLFTFIALASDLVWERWSRFKRRSRRGHSRGSRLTDYLESFENSGRRKPQRQDSSAPLISPSRRTSEEWRPNSLSASPARTPHSSSPAPFRLQRRESSEPPPIMSQRPSLAQRYSSGLENTTPTFLGTVIEPRRETDEEDKDEDDDQRTETSSSSSFLRRHSETASSETGSFGIGLFSSTKTWTPGSGPGDNPVKYMLTALWGGLSLHNIAKGFSWSLAITSMHYAGILALKIPEGHCKLDLVLVLLSGTISWIVCTVGCILMAQMESYLVQQILFAVVATTGVAAMHFTGMAAARFWSDMEAQETRGYPTGLPVTIVTIATLTCLAANGLLVHSATVARNKLTDIIKTRRKLWAALAQKENAEAAAQARSEFIASASHEIRTPLHQLQGYGDLLSREHLTVEGRVLLCAIQDATKTLSLITNNVLDWSRLEKGESAHRPTFLDVRNVVDSVIGLLPNRNEEAQVEILVAVSPEVPSSIFIDELSLTRIILNLVSNASKFTTHGYILLSVTTEDGALIVKVEDTGCGVPESFLPHLFEPFKQAQTRGAERGTGLGLSIVKQLLAKMQGTIEVDSSYRDDAGVGVEKQGSKFTVSIPLAEGPTGTDEPSKANPGTKVAVFEIEHDRLYDGLTEAWSIFGVETQVVEMTDLTDAFKYVWASVNVLVQRPQLLRHLLSHASWIVLVPYDNENSLYELLGANPPQHIVPVRRPLAWHRIMRSVTVLRDLPLKAEVGRPSVRFAEDVEIMNGDATPAFDALSLVSTNLTSSGDLPVEQKKDTFTIMLVEDNKINQKLGVKMIQKLGYDFVVANDGQEALELLVEQDEEVDLILCDQHMPRVDGLQCTKQIREMEEQGKLKGSRRLRNTRYGSRRIIIAVTAVVGPMHEARCKEVGTDAFLPKPLSLSRLKETLIAWLEKPSGKDADIASA